MRAIPSGQWWRCHGCSLRYFLFWRPPPPPTQSDLPTLLLYVHSTVIIQCSNEYDFKLDWAGLSILISKGCRLGGLQYHHGGAEGPWWCWGPWWYWGLDLRAQLQVPISGIVVLPTVFFSTFIMSTPRILLFKSVLKKFLWRICAEFNVKKSKKK